MKQNAEGHSPRFLVDPTRFLFFTGKGGVGKTSIACAAALALADSGKSVLLVSTDPASNLDEILNVPLGNLPVLVSGAARLQVLNIDPAAAAESYRTRVMAQMGPDASAHDLNTVREQLSGACTTEIAAFDERLADNHEAYDHIIFDTAPTGHPLAPQPAEGVERLPRRHRPGRFVLGAAFRPQDARDSLQGGTGDAL